MSSDVYFLEGHIVERYARLNGSGPRHAIYFSFGNDRPAEVRTDIAYVKTPQGFEVDFLAAHRDGRRELLQVCADPSTANVRERELRALADVATSQPKLPPALLVLTQEQSIALAGSGLSAQPAYEWMLTAA